MMNNKDRAEKYGAYYKKEYIKRMVFVAIAVVLLYVAGLLLKSWNMILAGIIIIGMWNLLTFGNVRNGVTQEVLKDMKKELEILKARGDNGEDSEKFNKDTVDTLLKYLPFLPQDEACRIIDGYADETFEDECVKASFKMNIKALLGI